MNRKQFARCSFFVAAIFFLAIFPKNSCALIVQRWLGQTVYVPVYSHIYADSRFKDKPFQLTAILSIRNTDMQNSFTLEKVDYYDSQGKLLSHYLKNLLQLLLWHPLAILSLNLTPLADLELNSL